MNASAFSFPQVKLVVVIDNANIRVLWSRMFALFYPISVTVLNNNIFKMLVFEIVFYITDINI